MQNEMEHGNNLRKRKMSYLRWTMSVGKKINPVWLNFLYYAGKIMFVI